MEGPPPQILRVDEDFIKTLNIEIIKGDDFSKRSSEEVAYILNEAAAKTWKVEDLVGRRASNSFVKNTGEIVGIVKDFHFASLHTEIRPLVLEYNPASVSYLLVKIKGEQIPEALAFLEAKSGEIAPGHLFSYTFLDDKMDRLYVSEVRMSDLFKVFTQLALIISCLGLFGLSAYSAQQRTKEVGVRKVLGASVPALVVLLSKEFIRLVFIAFVLAGPVAYFAMNRWLESFAYRVEVGPMVFVITLVSVLVIAWMSVSYQAIRAARANPVQSLRYE